MGLVTLTFSTNLERKNGFVNPTIMYSLASNYTYFLLSDECYCGIDDEKGIIKANIFNVENFGNDNQCDMDCPGDPSKSCGGEDEYAILYELE